MNPPTALTNHNPPATIGCGLNPNPIRREESDTPQKQTTAMLSQERVHRAHAHQMPAQRPRIQKLTIQTARTLHAHILPRAHPQHAEIRPNKSAHS